MDCKSRFPYFSEPIYLFSFKFLNFGARSTYLLYNMCKTELKIEQKNGGELIFLLGNSTTLIFDHATVAKQRVQKWFPQEAATGKHKNTNIGFRMEKWPDSFRSEAKLSQMEPHTKIQKL